jgi:phosphatidylglycerol---prolipoprotein diacylglyceryl transferase
MSPWRVDWNVSPIFMESDGGALRWYTALLWLELLIGYWCLARQIRRGGGDREDAADLAVYAWFGLLIGARLGHVLFYDFERLAANPIWAVQVWTGGLASHGGVLGVLLSVRLFARRRALSELEVCDRLTFSAGVVAVLHRFGNLFNSEGVGKPTDGTWGMRFPRFDGYGEAPLRHPSQLYEVALGLALWLALLWVDRKWGREDRPRGLLSGVALVGYFAGRFAVELFKEPEGPGLLGLDMGQLLSVPFVLGGIWLCHQALQHRSQAGWRLAEPTAPRATP